MTSEAADFAKALESLAPKYGVQVVKALIGLEDAMTRHLNRLERGISNIHETPYHQGEERLQEALAISTRRDETSSPHKNAFEAPMLGIGRIRRARSGPRSLLRSSTS